MGPKAAAEPSRPCWRMCSQRLPHVTDGGRRPWPRMPYGVNRKRVITFCRRKVEVRNGLTATPSMSCRRGVTRVTRLSPRCHEIVTPCHRYVATCHGDVTAESHICHKLSQAVTTAVTLVTLSHGVSKHLSTCRHVDISQLVWGGCLLANPTQRKGRKDDIKLIPDRGCGMGMGRPYSH